MLDSPFLFSSADVTLFLKNQHFDIELAGRLVV